jgi:hypothetical protein
MKIEKISTVQGLKDSLESNLSQSSDITYLFVSEWDKVSNEIISRMSNSSYTTTKNVAVIDTFELPFGLQVINDEFSALGTHTNLTRSYPKIPFTVTAFQAHGKPAYFINSYNGSIFRELEL